jgi:ABC-type sulfate/molybdate transport systems ATPase subunit
VTRGPAPLVLERLAAGDLQPLDLRVEPGEIVGLAGPSGSGKTRLLRAVADLEPHAGRARLGDVTRDAVPAHEWRRRVVLVPAESHWWHDTVGPHFPRGTRFLPSALDLRDDALDWTVDRLSSGEKQRLALARAMALIPEALLLDEPTANLDADSVARVEEWLTKFIRERGLPTLWVAHDGAQLERVADRRLVIVGDRVEGAP